MPITAGKWRVGSDKGCIVTDIPNDNRPALSWEDKEQEHRWYGGYVIAESIANDADAMLIIAAPDLLHALTCIVLANEHRPHLPYHLYLKAKAAVLKAATPLYPTPFYPMPELYKPFPLLITGIPDQQHHSYYAKH